MALLLLTIVCRPALAFFAREMAVRQIETGSFSKADWWIALSTNVTPGDGRNDLMKAAYFRNMKMTESWQRSVELSVSKGAPRKEIELEMRLQAIEMGAPIQVRPDDLISAGARSREVFEALLRGCMARGDVQTAGAILDRFKADDQDAVHALYLEGVYEQLVGRHEEARRRFEDALSMRPDHELVRLQLAQLLQYQDQSSAALPHYVALAASFDAAVPVQVGLASCWRRMGRAEEAREALQPLLSESRVDPSVAAEMAEIEFLAGNYAESQKWFGSVIESSISDQTVASGLATTTALLGDIPQSEELLSYARTLQNRQTRAFDLQTQVAIQPDIESMQELERLMSAAPVGPTRLMNRDASSTTELYPQHCAACHGANGDGQGRAARHLEPRPRDFRKESFRLVSTRDKLPTLNSIEAIIENGMPGTAMPAFEQLSEEERVRVAEKVLQFWRDGARQRSIDPRVDGDEAEGITQPAAVTDGASRGEPLSVPMIGPSNEDSIRRGKELYRQLGCASCHGAEGTPSRSLALYDQSGRVSIPRNLVDDPFKGGVDAAAVYTRLALGMPGTPHPASIVSETELVDLVHYCLSLSKEPKRALTNYERSRKAAEWERSALSE